MAYHRACGKFLKLLVKNGVHETLSRNCRAHSTTAPVAASALLDHIRTKILMRGGPVSMAEYMQDCLTSPQGGFYMHRDVFGSSGDFVTSPEISQLFGEMVGIWAVHTWMSLGRPLRLQLVEMGPGRGTLMADLLRGTAAFRDFSACLDVHLVEVSPALREMQWRALRCTTTATTSTSTATATTASSISISSGGGSGSQANRGGRGSLANGDGGGGGGGNVASTDEDLRYLRSGMTPIVGQAAAAAAASATLSPATSASSSAASGAASAAVGGDGGGGGDVGGGGGYWTPELGVSGFNGCRVTWHGTLDAVPDGPTPALYIAHEFFDALPVHQFVRDPKRGWLEKMVDVQLYDNDNGDDRVHGGSGGGGDDPIPDPNPNKSRPDSDRDSGSWVGAAQPRAAAGRAAAASGGGGQQPTMQPPMQQPPMQQPPSSSVGATVGSGLRLVLSPGPTPAAALLVPRRLAGLSREHAETMDAMEVSAVGMATAERLAQRIGRHGGAALLVDYGREGPPYGDSLMAIREHRGVGILDAPGSADLSAWVDFGALKLAAMGAAAPPPLPPPLLAAAATGAPPPPPPPPPLPVRTSGPVSQAAFLRALGIETRLAWLAGRATDPAAAAALAAGCARLLGGSGEGGMGVSYQVMAIHQDDLREVAGF